MEHYPEKLDIDDLFTRRQEVLNLRLGIFRKILNRAHKKIKITSRRRCTESYCFFLVPEFLVGTPIYDTAACTAFIMDKLRDNGFYVKYTHPNLLFISWNHYLDKTQRAKFKRKYGYSIDGLGKPLKKKSAGPLAKPNADAMLMKGRLVKVRKAPPIYKAVESYKPTGNLIYSKELLKRVETNVS